MQQGPGSQENCFNKKGVATVLERLSLRFGNVEATGDLTKRNFSGKFVRLNNGDKSWTRELEKACEVKTTLLFCCEGRQRNGTEAGRAFGVKGGCAGQVPIQDPFSAYVLLWVLGG